MGFSSAARLGIDVKNHVFHLKFRDRFECAVLYGHLVGDFLCRDVTLLPWRSFCSSSFLGVAEI